MVVAGILALALALPTGALFGVGYGTGVRIGYEQIYPLLFPADKDGKRNTAPTVQNIQTINRIYDSIGGKEASQMGIAVGLTSAMKELDKNPDFQDLLTLEYSLSGNTPSNYTRNRYGLDNVSDSGQDYSDSQQDVQDKTDERTQDYQNEYDKEKFRLAMEKLTDEKFIEFYNRRAKIYNSWQQQIMVLLNRLRFGKADDTTPQPVFDPETEIISDKELRLRKEFTAYQKVSINILKLIIDGKRNLANAKPRFKSVYTVYIAGKKKQYYAHLVQGKNMQRTNSKIWRWATTQYTLRQA